MPQLSLWRVASNASGSVYTATTRVAPGTNIMAIFPERGERSMATISNAAERAEA
ncbi:MAG TPA: hypothetical protein VGF67_21540 [Ktedonobacteraceae bacterium]